MRRSRRPSRSTIVSDDVQTENLFHIAHHCLLYAFVTQKTPRLSESSIRSYGDLSTNIPAEAVEICRQLRRNATDNGEFNIQKKWIVLKHDFRLDIVCESRRLNQTVGPSRQCYQSWFSFHQIWFVRPLSG